MTSAAASGLVELGREECLGQLARGTVGRVVVLAPGGTPVIRPVNYILDEASQSVVFRCAVGNKLISLLRAARAWFEVDEIDLAGRTGWSVVIAGVTEPVTRPEEVRRIEGLGLESWVAGPEAEWIRIRTRVVTGRRIGSSVAGTELHP